MGGVVKTRQLLLGCQLYSLVKIEYLENYWLQDLRIVLSTGFVSPKMD